jgi:hypothetical protein
MSKMNLKQPEMPLSKAMERAYTRYMSPTTWSNDLAASMIRRFSPRHP